MNETTRLRMIDILKGAGSLLVLVPDMPGIADNAAIGGLRIILAAVVRALSNGKSAAQIVAELEGLAPADRLDVDAEIDRLTKQGS